GLLWVHGDQKKLAPEQEVKQSDEPVEKRGLSDFEPGHRQDVTHEHLLQVLGLLSRLTHCQNGGRQNDRIADANDDLLRNAYTMTTNQRKDHRSNKRETETNPIRSFAMRIHREQRRDRGA